MRAEIISCGTELLLGHISDTNATYLAQSLAAQGIDLYYVSQVGDNQGRVVETLRTAWQRSDLVIMTGGLGPTEDDLTRESISALLGESMAVDPALEQNLRERFSRIAPAMPERNIKQATLIPSAQALANPVGTAVGWWVEKDKHSIVAMPGVPREMHQMWEDEVVPRLSSYINGLGESAVEEMLDPLLHSNNPTIATYAKSDAIDVRITAKAPTRTEAMQLVAQTELQARQVLGNTIFGVAGDTLASVVGRLLTERKQTVSVMESLTGGLLASTITDVAGSSNYFIGGIVSYSTELKAQMGVPRATLDEFGAVSEQTARAMAHAVRTQLKADFGIGVTGVAGPDKQEDEPVGTVYIAVEGPGGVISGMGPGWRGARDDQKRRAALSALDLLRHYLEGFQTPTPV